MGSARRRGATRLSRGAETRGPGHRGGHPASRPRRPGRRQQAPGRPRPRPAARAAPSAPRGARLTHAVFLLPLGGHPARHGAARVPAPRPPPPLRQETPRLGRHFPFLSSRDRMGWKKFAAEAVSCGTGRAERRGPDGKGRERRREAGGGTRRALGRPPPSRAGPIAASPLRPQPRTPAWPPSSCFTTPPPPPRSAPAEARSRLYPRSFLESGNPPRAGSQTLRGVRPARRGPGGPWQRGKLGACTAPGFDWPWRGHVPDSVSALGKRPEPSKPAGPLAGASREARGSFIHSTTFTEHLPSARGAGSTQLDQLRVGR